MDEEKTYKCRECGSETKDTAGNCCGGERVEACGKCAHAHKEDGACDCNCE